MKSDKIKIIIDNNRKPKIKFVCRANMWCKTSWDTGKQKIEWFSEKPNE